MHIGKLSVLALVLLVAGCGVRMRPDYKMPKPLLQPMNARVALLLDDTLRSYVHEETRGGGNWKIDLGHGHEHMFRDLFTASFQPLQVFTDIDSARAAGAQAIFDPVIEEFSFATASETAAAYWAVTIRYRIEVLDPHGAQVDSFKLSGYGSSFGERGSEASLAAATRAAMRDAASKFLVQMPRQALAQKLIAGQALSEADRVQVAVDAIEAVPIEAEPAS
jgi:hypothetical protein